MGKKYFKLIAIANLIFVFYSCDNEIRQSLKNEVNKHGISDVKDQIELRKSYTEGWSRIETLFKSKKNYTYYENNDLKTFSEECGDIPCNTELNWYKNGKLKSIIRRDTCYSENERDIETDLIIETIYCDYIKYFFDENGGLKQVEVSRYPFSEKSYYNKTGLLRREYYKGDSLMQKKNYKR